MSNISRRAFLQMCLPLVLAACSAPPSAAPASTAAQPQATLPQAQTAATEPPAAPVLAPTPQCGQAEATLAQTEGPYYTPNTPERTSLVEAGVTGTKLTVTGYVLTTACQPVARALLDFWHADDAGQYDNVGFKLRGHQFTDDAGRFTLETIVPGLYPGRTRHIHVKVQAPNQPVLTTQLYFPGEAGNATDGIYRDELLMEVTDSLDGKAAAFTFVLEVQT
jgi:protocatechuate 3,4-dioxygenase beta subunit